VVSGGSFFGGAARRRTNGRLKTGRTVERAVEPGCAPRPRRDGKPAAMTFITEFLGSLFGFDIVKLSARLDTLDDRKHKIVLIMFTLMADMIRFFVVTCLFVLILY
jgi:hypothetical protein